jgi:hypothetical protein
MAVNPVTPPVPQNSNLARAVYVWNPLATIDTDQHLQALLNFCSANGANVVFMDFYSSLGGANWTAQRLTRMQTALDNMHKSGIRVYALSGDVSWTYNQQWVLKNVIQPFMKYQSLATSVTHRFDGWHVDTEYWADANQQASVACPQLCDFIRALKNITGLPVGTFAAFFLKDNTGTRPSFSYDGKTAQDGEFIMDISDFVVVGAYRNHANDNGTDGPGQISLFQAWYDYAKQSGKNIGLYCGSETQNQQPPYITYFGMTKAQMEAQHTLISAAFAPVGSLASPIGSVFLGQAIDEYVSWAAMS